MRIQLKCAAALGFLLLMAGCRKKEAAQAPEPHAQNAFTDHIDQGIATMNKAQTEMDKTNAQTQAQIEQAQNADEPH